MPFAPFLPKEILPQPCHHLLSTSRNSTSSLPFLLSYVLSAPAPGALCIWARNHCSTLQDRRWFFKKKKRTLLDIMEMRWTWRRSPFRSLNQDSSYPFCRGRIKPLHCWPNKAKCINFHRRRSAMHNQQLKDWRWWPCCPAISSSLTHQTGMDSVFPVHPGKSWKQTPQDMW